MSSSSPNASSSSARPPRDLEDTLTFTEDITPVTDWYNRQSQESSTVIKRVQLRTEYAPPYHQFIVIQTQGAQGELEPGRAYRVDRGREREGWSVVDTFKKLGVPSRDTIAVLQQPVEELKKSSHCTIELHCSDDNTLDLSLILGVCFRIHNNWGTRYKLLTKNCYFFARTIINLCDDKLNKESSRLKSIWRRIFMTAYRLSAVLIWSLLYILAMGILPRVPLKDVRGFLLGLGVGILLVPIMLLGCLQVVVALTVRDMVAHAVKREQELEQEQGQGGAPQALGLEELERLRVLDITLGRIRKRVQMRRQWISFMKNLPLLVFGPALLIPTISIVMWPNWWIRIGVVSAHAISWVLVFTVYLVVPPFFRWWSDWRKAACTHRGGGPLDTDIEMGGVVGIDAPVKPEQELGVELAATGRPAHGGEGGAAAATEADQAEVEVVTGTATEVGNNNQGGAEPT